MKRFRSDQADVVDTGGAHDGDGAIDVAKSYVTAVVHLL